MKISKATRQKVYDKYDGHCAYCGKNIKYKSMQIDHIISKHREGADELNNLNPSCRSCNASKATYTIEEFRKKLIGDRYRIWRDSAKFRILERFGLVMIVEKELKFYFEIWEENENTYKSDIISM